MLEFEEKCRQPVKFPEIPQKIWEAIGIGEFFILLFIFSIPSLMFRLSKSRTLDVYAVNLERVQKVMTSQINPLPPRL